MYIKKISYSRLLKLEVPELAERVIGVFDTYDPEEFKIKEAYDQLVAQQPQIEALLARYKAHPLTVSMDGLRKDRAMYASEITSQMKFNLRKQKGDQDVIEANSIIEQFLVHLAKNNEEVINRKVTQFFAALGKNEVLSSTLGTLGLLDLCDSLESTHLGILRLLSNRTLSLSARPKGKTQEFAKMVINALKILFMQIEVSHTINEELDYLPMISTLNVILDRYRNLINLRAAYNKKKREEAEGELDMDPEGVEEPEVFTTFVAPTPGIELPKVAEISVNGDVSANGSNGELALPLEQKKSVVPSSKLIQLPSVNNEA